MMPLVVLLAIMLLREARPTRAAPITCQPLRAFPGAADFPTYHIMGHVSNTTRSGKGLGREAINDCSGIIEFQGVYHVFHQCCQNHWDHVVSKYGSVRPYLASSKSSVFQIAE